MGGLRSRWVGLSIVILSLVACGSDGSAGAGAGGGDGTSGGTGPGSASADGGPTGPGGDGGADPTAPGTPVTTLFGVWQVTGKDARGAYTGQLELRDAGGGKAQAIRVVQYTGFGPRGFFWVCEKACGYTKRTR